jgi:two-component sensor histidine kinase
MFLSLDTSIPCGLIINELLSNALKYAFPNNREGFIFVILKKESNFVKISIGDNGVGLPESLDLRNTDTLGLQLVNTLVEQIDGEMEVFNNKGTEYRITFKG